MIAQFTVRGTPAPKGSMRAFRHRTTGRVVTTHDNARTVPWTSAVRAAASAAMVDVPPYPHAVLVTLHFVVPRPPSQVGKRGGLLAGATLLPERKPDLDKLVRCVLDALKGVVWKDDAQVVYIETRKRYADSYTEPGVEVFVSDVANFIRGVR